jgi:hypothetical protein
VRRYANAHAFNKMDDQICLASNGHIQSIKDCRPRSGRYSAKSDHEKVESTSRSLSECVLVQAIEPSRSDALIHQNRQTSSVFNRKMQPNWARLLQLKFDDWSWSAEKLTAFVTWDEGQSNHKFPMDWESCVIAPRSHNRELALLAEQEELSKSCQTDVTHKCASRSQAGRFNYWVHQAWKKHRKLAAACKKPKPFAATGWVFFDGPDFGIGVGAQITPLWLALPCQTVDVFVGAALAEWVWLCETSPRLPFDVDQSMLGKFTAVVADEFVHASLQKMRGMDDGSHDRICLAIGYVTHPKQAGLAVDQSHHRRKSLAHNGIAVPVAHPLAALHNGRSFGDARPMKALALSRCSTAAATALPAAA